MPRRATSRPGCEEGSREALGLRIAVALAANALAILSEVVLLDDVRISVLTFGVAVVVVSAVSLVIPSARRMADREVPACAISLVALAATFLALVVTDALSDGLSVDGAGTWLSASVISVSARDLERHRVNGKVPICRHFR